MHVFQAVVCREDQARDPLLSALLSKSGGDSSEPCLGRREREEGGAGHEDSCSSYLESPYLPFMAGESRNADFML